MDTIWSQLTTVAEQVRAEVAEEELKQLKEHNHPRYKVKIWIKRTTADNYTLHSELEDVPFVWNYETLSYLNEEPIVVRLPGRWRLRRYRVKAEACGNWLPGLEWSYARSGQVCSFNPRSIHVLR